MRSSSRASVLFRRVAARPTLMSIDLGLHAARPRQGSRRRIAHSLRVRSSFPSSTSSWLGSNRPPTAQHAPRRDRMGRPRRSHSLHRPDMLRSFQYTPFLFEPPFGPPPQLDRLARERPPDQLLDTQHEADRASSVTVPRSPRRCRSSSARGHSRHTSDVRRWRPFFCMLEVAAPQLYHCLRQHLADHVYRDHRAILAGIALRAWLGRSDSRTPSAPSGSLGPTFHAQVASQQSHRSRSSGFGRHHGPRQQFRRRWLSTGPSPSSLLPRSSTRRRRGRRWFTP